MNLGGVEEESDVKGKSRAARGADQRPYIQQTSYWLHRLPHFCRIVGRSDVALPARIRSTLIIILTSSYKWRRCCSGSDHTLRCRFCDLRACEWLQRLTNPSRIQPTHSSIRALDRPWLAFNCTLGHEKSQRPHRQKSTLWRTAQHSPDTLPPLSKATSDVPRRSSHYRFVHAAQAPLTMPSPHGATPITSLDSPHSLNGRVWFNRTAVCCSAYALRRSMHSCLPTRPPRNSCIRSAMAFQTEEPGGMLRKTARGLCPIVKGVWFSEAMMPEPCLLK